jgi:glycosyltransferase involved in cell wall biosynthesis
MHDSRIRVLHVVHRLDRGGVETWLVHLLRQIDRSRFAFDFLVHSAEPGEYDEEVRALGANIYPCTSPLRTIGYARALGRILRGNGPYDVVHGHVQHFNGIVMLVAAIRGVPVRIAHSHLDTGPLEARASAARRVYLAAMRHAIDNLATVRLAASRSAGDSLFLPEWEGQEKSGVMYCGIDLTPFAEPLDSGQIRRELGLPLDEFVVGNVANFRPQKNHEFLIEIAAELAGRTPCFRLLLVGDGSERQRIESLVADSGLTDQVIFAGARSDVPRLMRGAMDVFVLPSLTEGLPLVGLEAQAAGRPAIFSDAVTNELDIVPEIVRHLPLSASASEWVHALLEMRAVRCRQPEALAMVAASPFNIAHGAARLEEIYADR